ncbi:MAG: 1-phosphofructokinase [Alphaproteobacteria bacterium CG_4_10_14_0_2_um_filter_63_37]|nr:MAG: 1-phosphofructokinase [Proteobacteria bacterium CG1_02_64_396]PJA25008.1 MAG: 1-phosphofructokinase [Alphaproteobacteria bacterium CG_4_10_14_0_2_um_filter_63_37]
MIITVTPNPTIDKYLQIDRLQPGHAHQVRTTHRDPGGKGVNVSRVLTRLGVQTLATGFAGDYRGELLKIFLNREGVANHFVPIKEVTRLNLYVMESDGTETVFKEPSPHVEAEHWLRLVSVLDHYFDQARFVVVAGSLPVGVSNQQLLDLLEHLRLRGVSVVLDARGGELKAGVGARPFLIKPNRFEAEELLGHPIADNRDELAQAAQRLRTLGPQSVLLSDGKAGAVLANAQGTWWATPPTIEVASTIGAGDSMVAGFLTALLEGADGTQALRLATAAGAATARAAGTELGQGAEIRALQEQVVVESMPQIWIPPV